MKRHLLLIPIVLLLAFIWGNSTLSGEISGAISGGLLGWLIDTFSSLSWMPEFLLRKLGHFLEFGLLGFLLAWYCRLLGQRGIHCVTMPLLFSVLAACVDETIQNFTPDRSSSVLDVWLDAFGAVCGMAVLLLGYTLYQNYRKGKKQ